MTTQAQHLLNAVLALPETEQFDVLEGLLESLSPESSFLADESLQREVERRHEEVLRGKSETVPWSELKRQPFT